MTARQRIEARIGKPLGPLATMPRDHRIALKLLAKQLLWITPGQRTEPDRMRQDGKS